MQESSCSRHVCLTEEFILLVLATTLTLVGWADRSSGLFQQAEKFIEALPSPRSFEFTRSGLAVVLCASRCTAMDASHQN